MAKQRNGSKTKVEFSYNTKGARRERLIYERKKRKMTQKEVAESIGFSLVLISHLENGRYKPSFSVAMKLEELYGVPHEKLFPDL